MRQHTMAANEGVTKAIASFYRDDSHGTKNWIYTKFTQCEFGAKKCKLRLNKGQRW